MCFPGTYPQANASGRLFGPPTGGPLGEYSINVGRGDRTVLSDGMTLRLPERSSRLSGRFELLPRNPGESVEDWTRRFQAYIQGEEGGELPPAAPSLPPVIAPRVRTGIGATDLRLG